jgi:hypothetical protein
MKTGPFAVAPFAAANLRMKSLLENVLIGIFFPLGTGRWVGGGFPCFQQTVTDCYDFFRAAADLEGFFPFVMTVLPLM